MCNNCIDNITDGMLLEGVRGNNRASLLGVNVIALKGV